MTAKQEGTMNKLALRLLTLFLISALMGVGIAQAGTMNHRTEDGKLKVLYHIDGSDLAVAKYAMALINKHIEAEGGPDKIDLVVVVHGPALHLFDKKDAQTRYWSKNSKWR
jgi:hypothetical protein